MISTESQINQAIRSVGRQLDRKNGPHLYRQIATLLSEQIQSQNLKPGDNLPTQRELSVIWEIGEVTVRRALQLLAEQGLLEAKPRSGTVVCDPHGNGHSASGKKTALTLGVAFADLVDGYPFFPGILAGLRADEREVAIQLFDMPQRENDAGASHLPPLTGLDGLIMMSPVNLGLLARSQSRKLPTVLLFSDMANGFSHCILPDYANGVTQAVGHLAKSGRKRIALVTAGPERFSTGRWIEAYRAAMRAYGLTLNADHVVEAGYSEREGAEATRELLELDTRPDAILYASDFMARGGLLAAHEAGASVPNELAIVGAGPALDENGWTVSLATIDLGLFDMGRLARQLIEAAIEGRSDSVLRQAVTSTFRQGQTA